MLVFLFAPMTMIFAIAHQIPLESTKFTHEIGGILALDIYLESHVLVKP